MLQVTDRHVWRSALESGRYELLNEENKENGIIKTVNEDVEEMEIDEQTKVIVKDRYKKDFSKVTSTFSCRFMFAFKKMFLLLQNIVLKSYCEDINISHH